MMEEYSNRDTYLLHEESCSELNLEKISKYTLITLLIDEYKFYIENQDNHNHLFYFKGKWMLCSKVSLFLRK